MRLPQIDWSEQSQDEQITVSDTGPFVRSLASSLDLPNLALIDLVHLVTDHHDWHPPWILIFDSGDLRMEPLHPLKGSSGCDGVYDEEALPFTNPLIAERSVLLLTCGI